MFISNVTFSLPAFHKGSASTLAFNFSLTHPPSPP